MAEDHQDKWNSDLKNTGVPVENKKRETLALPQSLHDFSPSLSQVLRTGRSYDSSSDSPSESVEIGRTGAINQLSSHGSLNSSLSIQHGPSILMEASLLSFLSLFPCHQVSNMISHLSYVLFDFVAPNFPLHVRSPSKGCKLS